MQPSPSPLISLVVPVYNEADNVGPFLRDVEAHVREPHETLLVYDFPEDTTLAAVAALDPPAADVRLVHNTLGRGVVEQVPGEGTASFALALELTLKAHWRGWRVAEVPTTWQDRTAGQSRFRLFAWLPHYLRWYLLALRHAWLRF